MFDLRIPATSANLDTLKKELSRRLPNVKSSHRCEALARGLGRKTFAALRTDIRTSDDTNWSADGSAFSAYLADKGFTVTPATLYKAVAKAAIRTVAEQYPPLTLWGYGAGRPRRKDNGDWESEQDIRGRQKSHRLALLSEEAVEQFLLSLALVSRIPKTKTIRPGTGSYRLKHIAEKYHCSYPQGKKLGPQYVSNGALIAAAAYAGFNVEPHVDEYGYYAVNANFNMSKKVVDDLDAEIRTDGAEAQKRRQIERWKREKNAWKYLKRNILLTG